MLDGAKPQFILDIGCGPGVSMPYLSRFASHVIGLDLHDRLGLTKKYVRKFTKRFSLMKADAQFLPLRDHCLEAIICMSVLDHITDPKRALTEVSRVSKDGSTIVVGGHMSGFVYSMGASLLILWTALRYRDFSKVREELFHGHKIEFPELFSIIKEEFEVTKIKTNRVPLTYVTAKLRKPPSMRMNER